MSLIDKPLDISDVRMEKLENRVGELERLLNRWATPVHTFIETFNKKTESYEVYDEMGALCGTFDFKGRHTGLGAGVAIYGDWQLNKDCPYIQPEMMQLVNYLKKLGVL